MAARLPIQARRPGIARSRTSLLLGPLVMLLLVMPVSYRAGADEAHPHPIFQPVIDRIVGHHHHHGDHDHAPGKAAPTVPDTPDMPSLAALKPAVDQPLALAATVTLLLATAAVATWRHLWPRIRVPDGTVTCPEPPAEPVS